MIAYTSSTRRGCTFYLLLLSMVFGSCAFKPPGKSRDIVYDPQKALQLDIYRPSHSQEAVAVLVFIHGGNWINGKKSTYRFFGKGMARKGIVCVVLDYSKGPAVTYDQMAGDVARAIHWVSLNISAYGGDPGRIFVSGHSAGGHLAALVAADNSYFETLNTPNPISGVILNDAFGLNIYKYLKNSRSSQDAIYYPTFSKDPQTWKKASPINYLHKDLPPFLIYLGGRTYPGIIADNYDFIDAIRDYQPETALIMVPGKKHAPMILQFIFPWNKRYGEILGFMEGK